MIAPRLTYRVRDREYAVTQVGEAWAAEVGEGRYFLTLRDNPDDQALRFFRERLRNADPGRPALIASYRYPLLLSIDDRTVRAWPAMMPRNRPEWSKTYINPATGTRVLATEGPYWIFATRGRQHSACGTASVEQTVDDVIDLAELWLRTADG